MSLFILAIVRFGCELIDETTNFVSQNFGVKIPYALINSLEHLS